MTTLFIDLETFSARGGPADLGTYEYARTAEILLVAYAVDDGPAGVWDKVTDPGRSAPWELLQAFNNPEAELVAHNAQFDRAVLDATDAKTDLSRWRCTMAKAYAHGLPGSLEAVGRILGLPQNHAKNTDGKKLIQRFCKPAPSNHKADRYGPQTHPEEWAKFVEYARQDVVALREIDRRLPDWNYKGAELDLWRLDQQINDRGFQTDPELVKAGVAAADVEKERLFARFAELTGGVVQRPTQREQFKEYVLGAFGVELENTQAATLNALLDEPIHSDLREMIEISIASNKTSLAKYASIKAATSPDKRFRGGLQFAGAARTRRWSGRNFQPQNLPSRLPKHIMKGVPRYIRALKAGIHDLLFDDLQLYGSAAIRGVVVAPEGRKLGAADLSNIEGRIIAWMAGEQWKLDAFAAFDRGEGPDLYNVTASGIIGGSPYEISGENRNAFGKVPELALGFAGGVGAIQNFARAYGVQMLNYRETILSNVDRTFVEAAETNWGIWGEERNAGQVDEAEWKLSESIKLAWRDRHPGVCALWKACEEAARLAIQNPGKEFKAGRFLRFRIVRKADCIYLLGRLPSGNFLVYFAPRVGSDDKITYMGVDSYTKQWRRLDTFGGKLVENAVQSTARDVLASSMPTIAKSGFDIILTVHDEVITEVDEDSEGAADQLAEIMATNPSWAQDLPLAAAGFEADRYRK